MPRALMQKGIEKCKDNVTDYLLDAKLIADTGRLYHAIISLEFALEEFGKSLLLKETMDNDEKDPVEINGEEFCTHWRKVNRALKVLDPIGTFRVLYPFWGDWFPRNYWGSSFPQAVIGDKLRLNCAFVDFLDNDWTLGKMINPKYFQEFVALFEQKMKSVYI